jgi:ATP-dependent Clp protease ATP-binding subunit ClpA
VFERFTEQARQVVVLAQQEARMLNHNYIGTEHLLLGLLREGGGPAAPVLESLGITLDRIREQVERLIGSSEEVTSGQIPFTPRAKKVLELALREAQRLGDNHIDTEHILLGLARENDGVAARVLLENGVDAETLRNAVIRVLPARGRRPTAQAVASVWAGHRKAIDPGWLGGLAPLLDRLAVEIRRELRREPDLGDLLLALASAPDALTGRAVSALGIDLDRLWGAIERLRTQASGAQEEIRRQIESVCQAKEQAIEAQQFDRAAQLRDEERELREQALAQTAVRIDEALEAVRRHLGIPRSPEISGPDPDDT